MDAKLARIKELIETKERVDAELEEILNGAPVKKKNACGHCGLEGHSARTCPTKGETSPPANSL